MFDECQQCGWLGNIQEDSRGESERWEISREIINLRGGSEARPHGGRQAGWIVTVILHDSRVKGNPSVSASDRSRLEAYRQALKAYRVLVAKTDAEIAARPKSLKDRIRGRR